MAINGGKMKRTTVGRREHDPPKPRFVARNSVDSIDAYFDVLAERPDLFVDRPEMHLIVDRRLLVAYAAETGTDLGVVLESPFYRTLVDLVEVDGEFFPYSRMIAASGNRNDGVVALAIKDVGSLRSALFVEMFRHSTGQFHLELPRGFAQDGRTLADSAVAELREETGYSSGRVRELGLLHTDTGYMTQRMALFLLTDLEVVGTQRETLELVRDMKWLSLTEIDRAVASGQITDSYAVQALYLFERSGL
jgi:ADP-ribose pyrophosphatase